MPMRLCVVGLLSRYMVWLAKSKMSTMCPFKESSVTLALED